MTFNRKLFPILLLTIAPAIAHAITITLTSNGAITGTPGQVVGYGFTFTNNGADYAVLDDSYLNFRAPFASPTRILLPTTSPRTRASRSRSATCSPVPRASPPKAAPAHSP